MMKRREPGLELMKLCSDMLEDMWIVLDTEYRIAPNDGSGRTFQTNGEFVVGYANEIMDSFIYEKHGLKTSLYETGEETEYFGKPAYLEMDDEEVYFEGYIDTNDTGCDPEEGCNMLRVLYKDVFSEIAAHPHLENSNKWCLGIGIKMNAIKDFTKFKEEQVA
jgi:hypothetical protein